jgi:hypothetical protein
MKAIRTAVVVSVGLIVALWWAVLPPRFEAKPLPGLDVSKAQQCPLGTKLEGKQCVCPAGTSWSGSACS